MNERKPGLLIYSAIFSAVIVVMSLIGSLTHWTYDSGFKWFPSVAAMATMGFICSSYVKAAPDEYSFGNVMGYATKVSLLAGIVVGLYTVFAISTFFPDLKELAMDQARLEISKKPEVPEETIEKALAITNRLFLPIAVFGAFFSTVIIGLIGGLLSFPFCRPYLKES